MNPVRIRGLSCSLTIPHRYLYYLEKDEGDEVRFETMVVKRESLFPQVEKILRKRFTKFDGWELLERKADSPDFVFELKFKKELLRAFCKVIDTKINDKEIEHIRKYAKDLSGAEVQIFAQILAVPPETRVPELLQKRLRDEHIELLVLGNTGR
jgi:hypothetical protein